MKWELVIKWSTGETDVYEYDTREKAEQGGHNMQMALGLQVAWYGVRRAVK